MFVKLKGLTKKGKERIKQHGEIWKVRCDLLTRDKMGIESLDKTLTIGNEKQNDLRVILRKNDPDFEIVKQGETYDECK